MKTSTNDGDRPLQSNGSVAVFAMAALTLAAIAIGSAEAQQSMDGESLYVNNCAACHGLFGEGDGPVAAALRMGVANLRTLQERNDGVFPAEAVTAYVDGREIPTAHGSRTMPVWGDAFQWAEDDEHDAEELVSRRIEAVVAFLEMLQYR